MVRVISKDICKHRGRMSVFAFFIAENYAIQAISMHAYCIIPKRGDQNTYFVILISYMLLFVVLVVTMSK